MDPIRSREGRPAPTPSAAGQPPALWLPRSGMGRSARIRRMLELAGWRITHRAGRADAFAGWGRKDSGLAAARLAARYGKPALAVEDGFLRSVGLGLEGAPPLSLTIDGRGVYYDASVPSDLETLLRDGDFSEPALLARARRVRERIVGERLTKYNASYEPWPARLPASGFVLVVDQTRGDRGLVYGGADGDTFRHMLRAARADNPGAPILVKTHPDVLTGKRLGCFEPEDLAGAPDLHFCTEDVDPWLLLDGSARVYTATSQLGFEAVLAGRPVRVFGAPFYAGWGLTEDAMPLPRRGRDLGLDALVAAVLMEYPLYYDPLEDELCSVETAIDRLVLWRDRRRANRTPSVCLGFGRAERPVLEAALASGLRRPVFARTAAAAVLAANTLGGRVVVTAEAASEAEVLERCRSAGVPLLVARPGPDPVVGIPSGARAASILLDEAAVEGGSRIEARLGTGGFDARTLDRAERLIVTLRDKARASRLHEPRPDGARMIFAAVSPGETGDHLVRAIRAASPSAFVAYAPPSPAGAPIPPGVDRAVNADEKGEWISRSDEVWTSSAWIALAALIAERPVTTLGAPFCAGWGLTRDLGAAPERSRRATLPELVAAALLLEPIYVDRATGLICDPEFLLSGSGAAAAPTLSRIGRRLKRVIFRP